jgi:hypothetical protein
MHLVGYKVLTLAADPGTSLAGYIKACPASFLVQLQRGPSFFSH